MRLLTFFILLSIAFQLACQKEKDCSGKPDGIEGRWILAETFNPWTSEVTTYTEGDTPETFEFRPDSTFTKFLTEENCSIDGTFQQEDEMPRKFNLTYQEESSDCPVYGHPSFLILENEQLIHDGTPWDGARLVYRKQ